VKLFQDLKDGRGDNMKILIVDDSFSIRRILKNILNELGYDDIDEAEDGAAALTKMAGVELLLTDWNMPNMNGLELVKNVKANVLFKNVPIIMITTEGGKKEVIEAIKAGVSNYVVKPFTKEVVNEKLQQVLKK
jgi:two-component system, chemotaxis family, chemotaxis protein CheY